MRMVRLAVTGILAVMVSCWASGSKLPATANSAEVTQSEYEVLSQYIAATFTAEGGQHRVGHEVTNIVIAETTQSDHDDDSLTDDASKPFRWSEIEKYLHQKAPRLADATLDSFRDACAHPAKFDRKFQLPVRYELVDKKKFDTLFSKGGWWTDYYKEYPGSQGFLNLSRVGFSRDGRQAFFYAANHCGGLCGTGTYVVMEKVSSNWKIAKEILIWIS